jgi:hypothetical protein
MENIGDLLRESHRVGEELEERLVKHGGPAEMSAVPQVPVDVLGP